jgi:hypothetical protein
LRMAFAAFAASGECRPSANKGSEGQQARSWVHVAFIPETGQCRFCRTSFITSGTCSARKKVRRDDTPHLLISLMERKYREMPKYASLLSIRGISDRQV